jgi:hypothetical protein
MQTFVAEEGVHKVVGAAELETWTLKGWVLVFCFQEEWYQKGTQGGYNQHCPTCGAWSCTAHPPRETGFTTTATLFLLRKSKESAIASLTAELEDARKGHSLALEAAAKATADLVKSEETYETLAQSCRVFEDDVVRLAKARDAFQQTGIGMQRALDKIKLAVGEREFKKLVEGERP